MAMSEPHRERLRKNRVNLVTYMKVTPQFLATFVDGNVLTLDMIDEVNNITTRQSKVGRVLDMLARRGGRAFNRLIEALKITEQNDLIIGLCPQTRNIQDPESINEIIHFIDAAPKDLTVIPMTDADNKNRDDLISAGKIYPTPREEPHGRAVILTCGPETILTTADTELLVKLFTDMHFHTKEYTCKEQKDVIDKLTKDRESLTKDSYESLILFILGSSNEQLDTTIITSLFDSDKCPSLLKKPKIFFISSEDKKPIEETSPTGLDEPDYKNSTASNAKADVKADQLIIKYDASSAVGPAGGRFGGSMFIKCLAHSFAKHARESSIETLIGQVINVGQELRKRDADSTFSMNQQARLRYDFYFSP